MTALTFVLHAKSRISQFIVDFLARSPAGRLPFHAAYPMLLFKRERVVVMQLILFSMCGTCCQSPSNGYVLSSYWYKWLEQRTGGDLRSASAKAIGAVFVSLYMVVVGLLPASEGLGTKPLLFAKHCLHVPTKSNWPPPHWREIAQRFFIEHAITTIGNDERIPALSRVGAPKIICTNYTDPVWIRRRLLQIVPHLSITIVTLVATQQRNLEGFWDTTSLEPNIGASCRWTLS